MVKERNQTVHYLIMIGQDNDDFIYDTVYNKEKATEIKEKLEKQIEENNLKSYVYIIREFNVV